MEISVQARHEETVRPEIGRLHASARAEGSDKAEVVRKATAAVNALQAQFNQLQNDGGVVEVVVRPITTSSWRPVVKGRQQPTLYRANASLRADFSDFAALAEVAAQFGGTEGVELDWVEWRLTEATRLELERVCLTKAVQQARERATVIAQAAGAGEVSFVQLADPGLLGEAPSARQAFESAPAPMAMMRSAKMGDDAGLAGIELQPEDLSVSVVIEARLNA